MTEAHVAIELVKAFGFPALLFIVWYVYHRAENEKWKIYLEQVKDDHAKRFEEFNRIIEQQEATRNQIFKLLQDAIEATNYHSNIIARIEQKVDTNQFCPLVRKEKAGS